MKITGRHVDQELHDDKTQSIGSVGCGVGCAVGAMLGAAEGAADGAEVTRLHLCAVCGGSCGELSQ